MHKASLQMQAGMVEHTPQVEGSLLLAKARPWHGRNASALQQLQAVEHVSCLACCVSCGHGLGRELELQEQLSQIQVQDWIYNNVEPLSVVKSVLVLEVLESLKARGKFSREIKIDVAAPLITVLLLEQRLKYQSVSLKILLSVRFHIQPTKCRICTLATTPAKCCLCQTSINARLINCRRFARS